MANDCERFEPKLALMASNDLGVFGRRGVERHVARCAHCRDALEAYRGLRGGLAELRGEPAGTTIDAARLDVPSILAAARTAPSALAWRPMTTAAALLIACLALIPLNGERALDEVAPDASVAEAVALDREEPQAYVAAAEGLTAHSPSGVSEIRFTTSDPDVVIIMVFDEQEDSTHEPAA